MIDAIYRAESGTQNRVKAKLSPRTTRECLTSMIPERKIKKGDSQRKCVYTYEIWVLSVSVGAELQHSCLLPWGGFPLNNITRLNAQFP